MEAVHSRSVKYVIPKRVFQVYQKCLLRTAILAATTALAKNLPRIR